MYAEVNTYMYPIIFYRPRNYFPLARDEVS